MRTEHTIVQNLPDGSSTPVSAEGTTLVKRGGQLVAEPSTAAVLAHNADALPLPNPLTGAGVVYQNTADTVTHNVVFTTF